MNDTFKQDVAGAVWDYEWWNGGLRNLSGVDLDVRNVRINKKTKKVLADVILNFYDDPDCQRIEKYSDCSYSFKALGL